jgi:hypothetical protein
MLLLLGVLLCFFSIWGGAWLTNFVPRKYKYAAVLTALFTFLIGITLMGIGAETVFN